MSAVRVQYHPGDEAYIVENGQHVTKVSVLRQNGRDFCTVSLSPGGAIKLRTNRLFPTREAAEATLADRRPQQTADRGLSAFMG